MGAMTELGTLSGYLAQLFAQDKPLSPPAKAEGKRIVAVGTTTTRALESAAMPGNVFTSGKQTAELTITPGYRFKAVDALLTNFHLPKSSLLVLVSTFGGHGLIMSAYEHAVRERYRFYSYGDCMFVY